MMADNDSPWSIQQITEYFKEYSSSYDDDISFESYPAPYIIASWVKQERSIVAQQQVKVMDLGCGTGTSSKLFFDDDKYHVHGIDATKEMLEKAKELPFKTLHCQNLEQELMEKSEMFDVVVCVGVFDFITKKKSVLSEISRILKQGGVAGITIPDCAKRLIEEYSCQVNLEIIKSERFFGYRDSTNGEVVNFWGFFLKKI